MLTTIIIPYYRKSLYLEDTLNSVFNQTHQNFEVVIIFDDNNKDEFDKFKNIISKFDKNKIVLINNKSNFGVSYSRNKALRMSRGEFIAFLDADDIWNNEKISKQIIFMQKQNLDFSYTGFIKKVDGIEKKTKFFNKINYQKLLQSCYVGLSTVMITDKLATKIQFPDIETKEDYIVWLDLLKTRDYIYGLSENLTIWNATTNSLSSGIFKNLLDTFRVFYKFQGKGFFLSIFYTFRISLNYVLKNLWVK